MKCSNCQAENPDDARFCMNCGNPFSLACTNCGASLPAEAKFCFRCGHPVEAEEARAEAEVRATATRARLQETMPQDLRVKLETARASRLFRGERKLVTALFADLVGSTALAGGMDPEDYREIVSGAHQLISDSVYKYEGTIAQLLGDGVLAFFGAPLAHEDDAERSVHAALEIQAAMRKYGQKLAAEGRAENVQLRIGLNTGTVVVGNIGTDLHTEYLAVGDAVNIAARMEQAADPGTVQVSNDTYKLVAPLFDFDDMGAIQVKGKRDPVQAYQALRPKRARGRVRGIEGLDSPLVERDAEIQALHSAVAGLRAGRGQIVSVMGEAGLGKSRLLTELRMSLTEEGLIASEPEGESAAPPADGLPAISWYEGRSFSYESSRPYSPFIVLLGDVLGLLPEESEADTLKRIRAGVNRILPSKAPEVAPYLATLLGLQPDGEEAEPLRFLEPPQLRARVFQAVSELLAGLAQSRPVVLVFDDVHWIDPTSLDLLKQLLPLTDRAPMMIAALFRPRREEPSWGFHETAARDFDHRYASIELKPLGEDGSRMLLSNLLHVENLPEAMRGLILAKSEGNPFYVEEVIRSLLDSGLIVRENSHWRATSAIEDIAVPDTLVGVIASRLDRLDEETKRVSQAAAVIGRQFELGTLAAVAETPDRVEGAVAEMLRRGLIHEKSPAPLRVYQFKHTLTQETAYGSLLRRDAQVFHRRVAHHLEEHAPDRPEDIARHFLGAGEDALALPHLISAGERAARAYSSAEAIEAFTRATEIPSAEDLSLTRRGYEGLGGALTFAGDLPAAIETYQKMLDLARASGDTPMQVSALNKLGFVYGVLMEQYEMAHEVLAEAESLARDEEDKLGLAELHMVQCGVCTATGDLDGAYSHLGESAQLGRDLAAEEPLLFGLAHAANTLMFMARFEEAREKAAEALQEAEARGNLQFQAEIQSFCIPWLHVRDGDFEAARETVEKAAAIAHRIGAGVSMWQSNYTLAQLARFAGDFQSALTHAARSVELGRSYGVAYTEMLPTCMLGGLHMEISPMLVDRVQEHSKRTISLLEKPSGASWGAAAWAELGFCFYELGDLDKAESYFQRGLTTPTAMSHLMRPRLLVGSAMIQLNLGKLDEAAESIREARGFVQAKEIKSSLPLVLLAEAKLKAAQGQPEVALENYAEAHALAAEMNLRPQALQALSEMARLLQELGRAEEAEARRREAQAVVAEMADLFEDDTLRDLFLENAQSQLGTVLET